MARGASATPIALMLAACNSTSVAFDEPNDTAPDAARADVAVDETAWDTGRPDPAPDAGSWSVPDATLDDAPRAAVCPTTPPVPDTPCTPYDTWESYCSYGTETLSDCRTIFRCREGNPWVEVPRCKMVADCPTQPAARKTCGIDLGRCLYADGEHCVCSQGEYRCSPLDVGCPIVAPNAGTLCATEGQVCDYRVDEGCCDRQETGYLTTCKRGVWSWQFNYGGP